MTYGGQGTSRKGSDGLVHFVARLAEKVGLLNKGSADAPAAPDQTDAAKVGPVASNSLNVTRVGGLATLIAGVGAAALTLFDVSKDKDKVPIVVVAYGGTALIVAAALIAVAMMIMADIRARAAIATAAAPVTHPALAHVSGAETKRVALDPDKDVVVVDASEGSVEIVLPDPAKHPNRWLTIEREDDEAPNSVTLKGVADDQRRGRRIPPAHEAVLYSSDDAWHRVK